MNNQLYQETFLQNKFLLENIQGGIVYSDFKPPFHLRYATEGMAKLCGYTVDEITKMQQMDLVHEEDAQKLADDVAKQFAIGDIFEVEYRLKRKDGTYVYVLDRAKVVTHENGEKYIHCLLTDISDLKEMQDAIRLNEEKYKIAIQQSGKVILEYNIATKKLSFSENYRQLFGCSAPSGTLGQILKQGWAEEAYKDQVIELFDEVITTKTTCFMELLIQTEYERYIWCSLYLIPVINEGQLYSVIGCFENIDEEKHKIEKLTELSLKDGLTGLFNRYAVEKFVKEQIEVLSEEEASALLILDIDRFKEINDKYGHDYGDKILIKLAQTVNSLLPANAIVGRLGGDEFLIFVTLKKITSDLEELANTLVTGVKNNFMKHQTPLTISLGAAWYSEINNTFAKLYRNADMALYETKNKNRDNYTIYKGE